MRSSSASWISLCRHLERHAVQRNGYSGLFTDRENPRNRCMVQETGAATQAGDYDTGGSTWLASAVEGERQQCVAC